MQKFDYVNLLWQIDRKFSSRAAFCKAANIAPGQLKHMQNGEQLTARTIKNAAQALEIPPQEIGLYFFREIDTSTILRKQPQDITPEEWQALFDKLTPENQKLFLAKLDELLAEQEQEQATANN